MRTTLPKERIDRPKERGAALVTVILITILLLTASIAMLSAAGANSMNTTDVLSEAKAYYAAESGLQATINVLRNTVEADSSGVTYSEAHADPDLSTWLAYNYQPGTASQRIVVGSDPATYSPNSGTAYSIFVSDPDNSEASLTFSTYGRFAANNTNTITFPSGATSGPRTVLTFSDVANSTVYYNGVQPYADPELTTITVQHLEGGAFIGSTPVQFRILFSLTSPRQAVKVIYGKVTQPSSGAPLTVTFESQQYSVVGSVVELCSSSNGTVDPPQSCATVSFALDPAVPSVLYANISPVPPYRLKVESTGYGPGGARKRLEAIVQRNLFNGVASGAANTMLGENCVPGAAPLDHCFEPGTSNNVNYSGGNCDTTGCVPTFGLTNPTYLQYVLSNPPGRDPGQYDNSLPQLLDPNAMPDWQSSPAALDAMVDSLRTAAQNSGRYFLTPGTTLNNPGNYTTGTGITFCEGSCTGGGEGGGILVVTGKLTSLGGFDFRGLIIVTGEEGWQRNGGGNGTIIGNVVIAPYNRMPYVPENHTASFLAPRYWIHGGGTSDIIYADVSTTFDELSSVSDFVAGVAEK